ncbi:hypothetical protein ACH4NC_18090 [Streptomyces sp. NPDC017201]|uniref:hypothetical protein n=1 Tax=unclassified Streptomyces TaxID=2593676 RepID=UPI0029A3B754|nr:MULTISPECIES: hypothetical protein [unclassified Streptomyces]MDX2621044.1 hypothetical protein [Streptomyces sp. WI03-5b]MDX3180488.1 hypothetical protein [Streptomyces sp. ME02-7008A-1]MDX3301229.1 hypothetical protein [Streptomyces sp. ME02-7008A]
MGDNCDGWQPTGIRGLEVRSDGTTLVAMRLHGWHALMSISLVQVVVSSGQPSRAEQEAAASPAVPARKGQRGAGLYNLAISGHREGGHTTSDPSAPSG